MGGTLRGVISGRPSLQGRQKRGSWNGHFVALAAYLIYSLVLVDHGVSLTRYLAGEGTAPYIYLWFLAWWPYAIAHHLPLLTSPLLWSPLGVSLPWLTSIPALAVVFAPLTAIVGPVVTYNILVIAAPALCAWLAHLVCFRLTGDRAASLVGGFLFGFSSYEMAQNTSALNLSAAFCVPALLLVVLSRVDGSLTRRRAVAFAALLLTLQFYISIEVFALIFVFGGIAWMFAYLYAGAHRPALRTLFIDALVTAPFVIVAAGPFLVVMARTACSAHRFCRSPAISMATCMSRISISACFCCFSFGVSPGSRGGGLRGACWSRAFWPS